MDYWTGHKMDSGTVGLMLGNSGNFENLQSILKSDHYSIGQEGTDSDTDIQNFRMDLNVHYKVEVLASNDLGKNGNSE